MAWLQLTSVARRASSSRKPFLSFSASQFHHVKFSDSFQFDRRSFSFTSSSSLNPAPAKQQQQVQSVPLNFDILENENAPDQPSLSETPCILLHGLLGSRRNLRALGRCLPFKTLILPDLRNHGKSPHTESMDMVDMAADVTRLMDLLNVEEACVVGHSMGECCLIWTILECLCVLL